MACPVCWNVPFRGHLGFEMSNNCII